MKRSGYFYNELLAIVGDGFGHLWPMHKPMFKPGLLKDDSVAAQAMLRKQAHNPVTQAIALDFSSIFPPWRPSDFQDLNGQYTESILFGPLVFAP